MDKPKLKATASPKTRQQFKLEKNTKFQADFRYNQSKVTLRDRNVGRSSNFILPVERYEKPCETSLRRSWKQEKKRERERKKIFTSMKGSSTDVLRIVLLRGLISNANRSRKGRSVRKLFRVSTGETSFHQ